MFSPNEIENIKKGMEKLKNQVHLKVFTDFRLNEDGTKNRSCMMCEGTINLLQTLAEHSNGKLEIDELSLEENAEQSEKYNVKRVPTILFLDEQGAEVIRYTATPTGPELAPFIETLQYYSGVNSFYRDTIQANLKKMGKSSVKLFITLSCPYCPSVVPILNLFAILSKGKIKSEIIDINLNPDMATKYTIQGVPHAMINEKDHLTGMFSPQDLLDKLTKGQRDFGGMYA